MSDNEKLAASIGDYLKAQREGREAVAKEPAEIDDPMLSSDRRKEVENAYVAAIMARPLNSWTPAEQELVGKHIGRAARELI